MVNVQDTQKDRAWRRQRGGDVLGTLVWALSFIWAGVVLLADNLGWLAWLQVRASDLASPWRQLGLEAWPLIFLGAGLLICAEIVLRLVVPALRRPVAGRVLVAVVLLGLGLGSLTNWMLIWPLLLIVVGVAMLLDGLLHGR